jgi:hypothetical protein
MVNDWLFGHLAGEATGRRLPTLGAGGTLQGGGVGHIRVTPRARFSGWERPNHTTALSSASIKNILIYRRPKSGHILGRPVAQKGAFRDRHGRCNGMRWTRVALQTYGANADGEVVWS